MNANETAAILALFAASFPAATVTEQTAKVWAELLEDIDPKDGLVGAKALVKSSTFFPSIAEFREASRSARRIRTGNPNGIEPDLERTQLTAGPEGRRPSREEVRELVRATKEMLSMQKGVERNHKQYPCPLVRCPWNSNPDAVRLGAESAESECDGKAVR